MANADAERLDAALQGAGWAIMVDVLGQMVKGWNKDLLTNVDLPEHERRGLVKAREALKEGVLSVYRKAGDRVILAVERAVRKQAWKRHRHVDVADADFRKGLAHQTVLATPLR